MTSAPTNAPGMSRRSVLRAIGPVLLRPTGLVTITNAAATACTSDEGAIEVFVNWSGSELDVFRTMLDRFSREAGRRVRVVPVGEQARELLRARFDANNPPDIALISLPGLIREYARNHRVVPLDSDLAAAIPASLNDTVTVDGRLYGLWVKAAHKSLFWYRPSALQAAGARPPATWDELIDLLSTQAAAGRPMLSIGAADGWVLTDWFENILAGIDGGDTYTALANGAVDTWNSAVVTDVLRRLADLWSIPGVFPHGAQRALVTQHEESVFDVFAADRSAMVFEGDFVGGVIATLRAAGRLREEPRVFRFPAITGEPPLVVGGDVAACLTDSNASRELLRWLSAPESMADWVAQTGFLSPDTRIPLGTYPELSREFARQFRAAKRPLFDLSDQLGGRLGAGQARGLPRILTEFLQTVSDDPDRRDRAIRTAQARLHQAAKGVTR